MTLTSAQLIALLPLLITSGTAILVMISVAISRDHWRNSTITGLGLGAALVAVYFASKLPDTGITDLLVVDSYSCFYMALILVATLVSATLCHAYMDGFPGNREEIYMLMTLAASGGIVLVCSRHLASMFIGLELLSVPVYGMAAYTFREKHSLEAGMKYLILSAAASAILLFGMALMYAESGTLALRGLGLATPGAELHGTLALVGAGLLLAALFFKLSLVPFHLWTPDVYEGAPAPVATFLATASKVAVFGALLRFMIEAPVAHAAILTDVLAVIAFVSILVGNLLALVQNNLKRLLGYSSIAHFGYVLVAVVAAGNNLETEAVGVYLLTYVVTTLGAFGVVVLMSSPYSGSDAAGLFEYRGLFWRRPYLTAVLTIMMLSLAGIPLTAGFIGKFYIVAVGVDAHLWWLLGAVIAGSALGLYYYLRVMVTMYLAEPGMRRHNAPLDWSQRAGGIMVIAVALLMMVLGIYPQPFLHVIQAAGITSLL